MGCAVGIFSISSAIALASYIPTQMGRTAPPLTSLSTTIGRFVLGSIISPRIFISTSMFASSLSFSIYRFAHQGIRAGAGHPNIHILPGQVLVPSGTQKVQRLMLRGPADPLAGGFVE